MLNRNSEKKKKVYELWRKEQAMRDYRAVVKLFREKIRSPAGTQFG